MPRGTILVIEDTAEYAQLQMAAVTALYPDKKVIHVTTLEDAEDVLRDGEYVVEGIMTDNGYPLKPGGERLGAKSMEGGAGTLLIKRLREGYYGKRYQKLRVAWNTEEMSKDKVERIMAFDTEATKDRTICFAKEKTPHIYLEMAKHLRPTLH